MRVKRSILLLIIFMSSGILMVAQDKKTETFAQKMKNAFALPSPDLYVKSIEQQTNSVAIGKMMLKDTYLSPNEYLGYCMSYNYFAISPIEFSDSKRKEPKGSIFGNSPIVRHERLIDIVENDFRIASTNNKSNNRTMYLIDDDFRYSLLYGLIKSKFGDWYLGGGADINCGSVYNPANTNNPASLKVGFSFAASTLYTYILPFESIPARVILNGNISLAGCVFSPEFGESYYELFSLNNEFFRRIYFSNPKNLLKTNLKLSFDIPVLDMFNMNIGGYCNYYNSNINSINTEILTVGISLGITNFVQSVKGRRLFSSQEYKTPL